MSNQDAPPSGPPAQANTGTQPPASDPKVEKPTGPKNAGALFFAAAVAAVASRDTSSLPEKGFEIDKVNLYETKKEINGVEQVTNYRLGIVFKEEVRKRFVLTTQVNSETFACEPSAFGDDESPLFTASLWFGREYRLNGRPGLRIFQGMPMHPVQQSFENSMESLRDADVRAWAVKNGYLTSHQARDRRTGAEVTIEVLGIPLDKIPEDLTEVSFYGTVNDKGEVEFKVGKGNLYICMGTQPNSYKGQANRNVIQAGSVSRASSSNTVPPRLAACIQTTLDNAVKLGMEKLGLKELKVQVVQNRASKEKNLRARYHTFVTGRKASTAAVEADLSDRILTEGGAEEPKTEQPIAAGPAPEQEDDGIPEFDELPG